MKTSFSALSVILAIGLFYSIIVFLHVIRGCFCKIRIDKRYFLCILILVVYSVILVISISFYTSQTGGVVATPKTGVCNRKVVCGIDL